MQYCISVHLGFCFFCETEKTFLLSTSHSLFPQAYEEVLGFFSSSFPNSVFSDLAKALDSKCQAFDKLSALLKDLIAGKSKTSHAILGTCHFTRQS